MDNTKRLSNNKNTKSKLSKDIIDNIKNYNNEIVTIEDNVKAIRQNIGMWIGSKGNQGFINMVREILQNSFDEILKDSSPCTTVIFSFDEISKTVIVEDNGRGIPFGNILRIFEDINTSSNYTKKKGEYSSGLHGAGAKVTNALSSKFIIESFILGDARKVEFIEGKPWSKGELKIPNKEDKQGTRITFVPSEGDDALGPISVKWNDVYNLVKLILPLTKKGSIVYFNSIDSEGKVYKETIVNNDGIESYMYESCKKPLIAPIHLYKDTGEMKMDIIFTYDLDSMDNKEDIIAFGNCCPTRSGDHINGFIKGVTQYFTNYMNKIYLANSRSKISVNSNDVKTGLKVVISAFHLTPVFNGQAKEIMAVPELDPFIRNATREGLSEWEKKNNSDLNKVCKYLKDVADLRIRSDKEKIKITNKYQADPLNGLPSKFVAPSGDKDLELWICEGDSAGSTMKNHRNNERQGYFPIKGKIPNVFNSKDAVLNNKEIAGIIAIVGGGYGKNFDINKVKWKYIIIGTDADADGYHIASLLIKFFLVYMPGLIESGRVYKSRPPLYGIPIRGGKTRYFTFKIDYVKYLQKEFTKKYTICYHDNKPIQSNTLSEILYNNIDYVYELEAVSNLNSVDPVLLESVLTLRNKPTKEMQRLLRKQFRFISVNVVNKIPIIEGSYNWSYQTLILSDKLLRECKKVIRIMESNKNLAYKINNELLSLYSMMKIFDNLTPAKVEQYKGFGEMNGEKLYDSTVGIENRTLVRYTMEDAKKDFETIQYYESHKYELISGVKVTRFDLM